jgi:hypothetical protein
MAYQFKPADFAKLRSASDAQKLMKLDIRAAAGKDVVYVAVKNVKVAGTTTSLFLVTDNAKPWLEVLKPLKPALLVYGKCKVIRGPDKTRVAIKSASSGAREVVAKLATLAIKDKAFEAVDYEDLTSDKPGP